VRAMVVAAGPFANFILAMAIFASLLMIFGRVLIAPVVGQVMAESAAAEAGFLAGDRVLSIDGKRINDFQDIGAIVQLSSDDELEFLLERKGKQTSLKATIRREEAEDAFGNKVRIGRLGVTSRNDVEFVPVGPFEAVAMGSRQVVDVISTTFLFIARLVRGKESVEQLGGPVKMAKYAGQAASFGFGDQVSDEASFIDRLTLSVRYWVTLAAYISVSIGFLNLLPIPVLDGGHLVYYGYEGLMGKPVGQKVQLVGYQVGLLILVSFMIFVTWNDITGLFASTFSSNG